MIENHNLILSFSAIGKMQGSSPVCNEIIDDIEDLISSQDITPKERYSSRKSIKVKAKRKEQVSEDYLFILYI